MEKRKKIKFSKELNRIIKIFLVIAARLQSNTVKKEKNSAHCKERRQHFIDKWKKNEEALNTDLIEIIKDDRGQLILLGTQYFQQILSLIEGKTLKLSKHISISYRTGSKIPEVINKDLVIASLEEQAKSEGLDIKDLITSEPVIPKENIPKVIEILKASGQSLLTGVEKSINEKVLEQKIKNGKLKPEKIKGVRIIQNEFFGFSAPDVKFSEPIKTIIQEF